MGAVKRAIKLAAPGLYEKALATYWAFRETPGNWRESIRAIARRNARETIRAIARESVRVAPNPTGLHIVFFTVRGWSVHLATESLLASRLRAMGHDEMFLICADTLPFS